MNDDAAVFYEIKMGFEPRSDNIKLLTVMISTPLPQQSCNFRNIFNQFRFYFFSLCISEN